MSNKMLKLYAAILVLSLLFIAACTTPSAQAPEKSTATPSSSGEEVPVATDTGKVTETTETKADATSETKSESNTETTTDTVEPSSQTAASATNVKEISMTAKAWAFEPSTIELNKGDKVKLTVTATDVKHGISIFGINKRLEPNKPEVIEFTADEVGEFPFFCTVFCGDGHSGMKGKVIVR